MTGSIHPSQLQIQPKIKFCIKIQLHQEKDMFLHFFIEICVDVVVVFVFFGGKGTRRKNCSVPFRKCILRRICQLLFVPPPYYSKVEEVILEKDS